MQDNEFRGIEGERREIDGESGMQRGGCGALRPETDVRGGGFVLPDAELGMSDAERRMLRGELGLLGGEGVMLRGELGMFEGENAMLRGERRMLGSESEMLRGERAVFEGE